MVEDTPNPTVILLFSGKRKSGKDFVTDRIKVGFTKSYLMQLMLVICMYLPI